MFGDNFILSPNFLSSPIRLKSRSTQLSIWKNVRRAADTSPSAKPEKVQEEKDKLAKYEQMMAQVQERLGYFSH